MNKNDPEVFENTVASIVDMASILFAYQIGVYGFGMGLGVVYACFDAFLVIWMRKPISRFARSVSPFRFARGSNLPAAQETETQLVEKKDDQTPPVLVAPEVQN